jgi:hypothetical protein
MRAAFACIDRDRIAGKKIIVRSAGKTKSFVTLDEKKKIVKMFC